MSDKSRYFPDDFNWWEIPETCPDCHLNLHITSGQDIPWCPYCTIDRYNAQRGKLLLQRFKEQQFMKNHLQSDEKRGPFMFDMPL